MKSKKVFNNSGISLIEIIVAILIITIGMLGVLSLVIQNIKAQYINKNVLIASGLAQEGLELVRNVRDANWLTPGYAWDKDIADNDTYAIDYRGRGSINVLVDSFDDEGARLYINKLCVGGSDEGADCAEASDCDSNVCEPKGFYTHDSNDNTPTNFYRFITVTINYDPLHLDVKCHIRWKESNQNYDYTAETYLYNWR